MLLIEVGAPLTRQPGTGRITWGGGGIENDSRAAYLHLLQCAVNNFFIYSHLPSQPPAYTCSNQTV
jgi:hypothetical protein